MSLINWIFDIYQHTQIDQARSEAARARAELSSMRASGGGVDSERLERLLGELALATKTLQRVLIEHGVCSSAELEKKMQQIDLEDGAADGRTRLG